MVSQEVDFGHTLAIWHTIAKEEHLFIGRLERSRWFDLQNTIILNEAERDRDGRHKGTYGGDVSFDALCVVGARFSLGFGLGLRCRIDIRL